MPSTLSVAVVSLAGAPRLADTLAALRLQAPRPPDEVLVLAPAADGARAARERALGRFPGARLVEVVGNVPARRARGASEARGDVVALLEDSCVPVSGWAAALLAALDQGEAAVGGPVVCAPGLSLRAAAAFLAEFGGHLPDGAGARGPVGAGLAAALPGCNLAYPRRLLERFATAWRDGLREASLHEAMRRAEVPLRVAPGARVLFAQRTPYARALADRLHHGRAFGGRRGRAGGGAAEAGAPPAMAGAWLRAAAAPAVPVLLAARLAQSLAAAGAEGQRLAPAFPLALPLFAAWALGEAAGLVAGPGRSEERWT